jgi:hypothetical protein
MRLSLSLSLGLQGDCKGIITSMMMNSLLTSFLPHIGKPFKALTSPSSPAVEGVPLPNKTLSMEDVLSIANEMTKDPDVMDVATEMVQQQNLYYLSIVARLWLAASSATGLTLLGKFFVWGQEDFLHEKPISSVADPISSCVHDNQHQQPIEVVLFTPFVTSTIILLTCFLFTTKLDATNEVEDITNTVIRAIVRIVMLFFGAFTTFGFLCRWIFGTSSSASSTSSTSSLSAASPIEGSNLFVYLLTQYGYPPLLEGLVISGVLIVYALLICFKHADQLPEALPPRWKVMKKKDMREMLAIKTLLAVEQESNSSNSSSNSNSSSSRSSSTWAVHLPLN